jgi:hypothetical protein
MILPQLFFSPLLYFFLYDYFSPHFYLSPHYYIITNILLLVLRDHQGYRKPRGIGGGFSGVGVRV